MKCPYCAEEIKNEAQVCRHCGHDLMLVKFLSLRVALLDEMVANGAIFSGRPPVSANFPRLVNKYIARDAKWRSILLAVLLAAFVSIGSNEISHAFDLYVWPNVRRGTLRELGLGYVTSFLAFLFLVAPLLFGIRASLAWPGKHRPGYVFLSLLVGVLAFALQISTDFVWGQLKGLSDLNLIYSIFAFGITQSLMFLSGTLFGDLVKVRIGTMPA